MTTRSHNIDDDNDLFPFFYCLGHQNYVIIIIIIITTMKIHNYQTTNWELRCVFFSGFLHNIELQLIVLASCRRGVTMMFVVIVHQIFWIEIKGLSTISCFHGSAAVRLW